MPGRTALVCTVALIATSITGRAHAQSWETPSFFSPTVHDDIGLYLLDADGGDLGFAGIWRQSGQLGLGVRGGMGGSEGSRTALIGVELWSLVVEPRAGQPLAVSWITGGGAAFSDGLTWLRIPGGVSVGVEIPGPSFTLVPYVHPRVAFDRQTVDLPTGRERTDSEINLDVDLGADLMLAGGWVARIGVTVGHVDVFGVGLAYRIARGVSVR